MLGNFVNTIICTIFTLLVWIIWLPLDLPWVAQLSKVLENTNDYLTAEFREHCERVLPDAHEVVPNKASNGSFFKAKLWCMNFISPLTFSNAHVFRWLFFNVLCIRIKHCDWVQLLSQRFMQKAWGYMCTCNAKTGKYMDSTHCDSTMEESKMHAIKWDNVVIVVVFIF